MNRIKKISALIVMLILTASAFTLPALAKNVEYAPYQGYEYDAESKSVAAPVTYTYSRTVSHKDLELDTALSSPQDFLYLNDTLYVLDSGNGRILELNSDLTLKKVRDNFNDKDGNRIDFTGSKGFTVSKDGKFYVSDTEKERILIFDSSNTLVDTIEKPSAKLTGFEYIFDVTKLIINNQGELYAVATSVNDGAFAFSKEGEFLYFFGRNAITRTADVLLNQIKKMFMTREQLSKIQSYTPTIINNFDMDEKGALYTISPNDTGSQVASVRKINFRGTNVFTTQGVIKKFGDLEWDRLSSGSLSTNFTDIEVDYDGFIFLLDVGRYRVFQYSEDGQLIGTFGGMGEQQGTFETPNSVETIGDRVLVLDTNGTITEFIPTEYATYLRAAFLELDTAEPQQAIEAWEKVLTLNSNSQYPYYGLGMAYEKLGDYKAAMESFRLANSKAEYSDALHEYRKQFLSEYFWYLILGVVVFIALAVVLFKVISKKVRAASDKAYSVLEQRYTFPLYTLFHPSDGFEQFKYRRDLPSFKLSAIIVAVFFFVNVFQYFATGYAFNGNAPEDYSVLATLLGTVVLCALFIVGNWAVCSLFEGNGTIKEITAVTTYSLIPYIVSQFICVLLSNVLTTDEAMVITIITAIGLVWTLMLIFVGLGAVNQYYTGKNFLTILLTLFAMLILALMAFLFFSLIQQVLYFFKSIWDEYRLR